MYKRQLNIITRRCLNSKQAILTQQVSQRIIIPPEFNSFNKIPNFKESYIQFSDEISSIEKYYNELEQFKDNYLLKKMGKTYSSFNDNPNELIFKLDEFVELQIVSQYSKPRKDFKYKYHIPSINVYCCSLSDKLLIERYLDFNVALKSTLLLNGNDTTIFDILINAKAVLDNFEKNKDN